MSDEEAKSPASAAPLKDMAFSDGPPAGAGAGAGAGHGHGHGTPHRAFYFLVDRPGLAYCATLTAHVFWTLLFIILAFTVSGFVPYSNDVPLYIRDSRSQERVDAVLEGQLVADLGLAIPAVELRQSVELSTDNGIAAVGTAIELEILYIARGDAFSRDIITTIRNLESKIWGHPEYSSYCLRDYTDAEYQLVTDGDTAGIEALNAANTAPCAAPTSAAWFCDPTTGPPCHDNRAFPPGLLNCTDLVNGCTDPSDPDVLPADSSFIRTKSNYFGSGAIDPVTDPVAAEFYAFTDASFGAGQTTAKALRSVFRFAMPLEGYANSEDRPAEQEEKIADWIYNNFHDDLFGAGDDDVSVLYNGFGSAERYLLEVLPVDASYIVLSFTFVVVYTAIMINSCAVSLNGLAHILLTFGPAYIVVYYSIMQQRYFGIFNILSLYIITGISADGVFYLFDSWNVSADLAGKDGSVRDIRARRLEHSWSHTAKAVAVTSVTTCTSFLANASSSFPAISTFGLFAAALVIVNYVSLVVFFPTVLGLFVDKWSKRACCFGLIRGSNQPYDPNAEESRVRKLLKKAKQAAKEAGHSIATHVAPNRGATDDEAKSADKQDGDEDGTAAVTTSTAASAPAAPEKRVGDPKSREAEGTIPRFFRVTYSPFVHTFRYWLLFLCAIVLAVMLWSSSRLEADPNQPQFYPTGNNFQEFNPSKAQYFARGASVYALDLSLVFGIDPVNPIDRSGTNPSDFEDRGVPNFSSSYHISGGAECVRWLCVEAESQSDERETGGLPLFPAECYMTEFKEYVDDTRGAALWPQITGADIIGNTTAESLFESIFTEWILSNPTDDTSPYARYGEYIRAEGTLDSAQLRFTQVFLELVATINMDFEQGIALYETWERWLEASFADVTGPCNSVQSVTPAFISSGAMSFFFVQEQLIAEAFSGIALSLGLAWIVLTVATMNFIVAFYATFSIFCTVVCVLGCIPIFGWKLGVLESINVVLVVGLSVDFVAHLASAYVNSPHVSRSARTRGFLSDTAVSVISGAISTIGAILFLTLATIVFFQKFATFIGITIGFSLFWSLVFFPALCMSPLGPQGDTGNLKPYVTACWRRMPWVKKAKKDSPAMTHPEAEPTPL